MGSVYLGSQLECWIWATTSIQPGESSEDTDEGRKVPAKVPEHETALESGMRQAREMRRRSNKRRENCVEYKEKKIRHALPDTAGAGLEEC